MALTDFDDLMFPHPPAQRTSMYVSADMVLEALNLTYTSVADELTAFEQTDLSADDEVAATRALRRAAWWLLAKLRTTDHILEDYIPQSLDMVKTIVVSRAVYELMLSTGQSSIASERRISIEEMAIALFGADFKPAPARQSATPETGTPAGSIARIPRKRYP